MPVLINTSGLEKKTINESWFWKEKKVIHKLDFVVGNEYKGHFIYKIYTNFLGVSPFCYILNFYFFLPNRILVKHLENHSFTLKVYYRPILQENTYLVQKIGHFSWLSKPSVHLRVVMVFIFSDFFCRLNLKVFPLLLLLSVSSDVTWWK